MDKRIAFYNSDWNNYVAYKYFSKKEIIFKSVKNIHSQSLPKINLVITEKKLMFQIFNRLPFFITYFTLSRNI